MLNEIDTVSEVTKNEIKRVERQFQSSYGK